LTIKKWEQSHLLNLHGHFGCDLDYLLEMVVNNIVEWVVEHLVENVVDHLVEEDD